MASFVRDSKFRHTATVVSRREQHYEQLKVSNHLNDSNNVAANSLYLAYMDVAGSGSAVAVLPLTSTGKNHVPISAPSYQQPLIRAHSEPVQDLAFNPFNTQQLFTCASDATLKLWDIPVGGFIVDTSSPALTLRASISGPMRGLAPHLTADGLIAARGPKDVFLFDIAAGAQVRASSAGIFSAEIQSMAWSYFGNVLVTSSKDKKIRLLDLRQESSLVAEAPSHGGIRGSRVTWLGESPFFVSSGHSSAQERELFLWDSRNLSAHIKRERVDSSTSLGLPLFDPDTNLLVLAGKGDSSIRLYEGSRLEEVDSYNLYPLSNTPVGDVTRGAALMPKTVNDLMGCEVLRVLKLTDNAIQPVSFTVPRKEKLKFHADLYPPSVWDTSASLTASSWLEGANAAPTKRDVVAPSQAVSTPSKAAAGGGGVSFDDSISVDTAALTSSESAAGGASEGDSPRTPTTPSRVKSYGSTLKFRNMYGTENPKNSTYFNIKPNTTLADSPLISCSDVYWAIPYQGSGGGPVYVSKFDSFGKVEPHCPLINGHKTAVSDIAFSPFHSGLLATASADCTVKIWQLPEDPSSREPLRHLGEGDAVNTLRIAHCLRTADFHPTINGLLVTSAQDLSVRFHDIGSSSADIGCVPVGTSDAAQVANVSFNSDGSLISVACRDRVVRLVDMRQNSVVLASPDASRTALGRNLRAVWCSSPTSGLSSILSVSASNTGLRTIHLWDPRFMNEALCTRPIDNAPGQLFPLFDESSGVCFLAGKGDTIIRYYELSFLNDGVGRSPEDPIQYNCERGMDFQSSRDPITGVCLMPKSSCNVRNVEISRMLKLTVDSMIPISFTLPRAEPLKTYFQDDVYGPARSRSTTHSAPDLLAHLASVGDDTSEPWPFQPTFNSLQPEGMTKLSDKPAERAAKAQSTKFREAIEKQDQEAKQREETFNKLQNMALTRAVYHPNHSGGGHGFKVDAKPVHDDDDDDNDWDD